MAAAASSGSLDLHTASGDGDSELVRSLLQRDRHDPNSINDAGRTPLFEACMCVPTCVEVVRLLLEAGADASFVDDQGFVPLHLAAYHGHTDLIDMLHSGAPTTLNNFAAQGETSLWAACGEGHEGVVSKLISLGAMEHHGDVRAGPLVAAVSRGFIGVVRVIVHEGGIRAVGGEEAVPPALRATIQYRRPEILQLLLTVGGHGSRSRWANIDIEDACLIHFAASFCYPEMVSILLEAGAHEGACDMEGLTARDVIGLSRSQSQIQRSETMAVRLMLDRGPAYRARSWAWPLDEKADASGSGHGDGYPAGDAAASAAAGAAAVCSSKPFYVTSPVIGLPILRLKTRNVGGTIFTKGIARYSAKD